MQRAVFSCICLFAIHVFLCVSHASGQHHTCDAVEYRANLTFDMDQRQIDGTAEITICNTSRGPLNEVAFDLRDNVVTDVQVDNLAASYTQNDSVLTIGLPRELASLDTAVVFIAYNGTHGAVVPGGYATGVQFGELIASAKAQSATHWYVSMTCHWLPCNNVFADRAIYDVTFDVPDGYVAAGQGSLIDEQYGGGRSHFRWRMQDPIHPHTAGWAVGPYFHLSDTCSGVPVEYYVLKGFHLRVREYFRRLPDMIATFEHAWGPYPAEKIGFAMTDAGSLETHSMILLDKNDLHSAATPELEAHELAHHWWGNSVTPMDLRENWLSEGFAMYSEILYRANSELQGSLDQLMAQYAQLYMRGIAVSEGIQPLYDYRGHGAQYNYSSVIYIKGALVLNMLRHYMGDTLFYAGMQEYFRRYRNSNVTSAMFREVMADYAGDNLEQFFQQWVYEAGWPILYVEQLNGGATDPLRLRVRQMQPGRGWNLYELPLEVRVVTQKGDTLRVTRCVHMLNEDVLRINEVCNEEVASWDIDPDGYMLVEYASPTDISSQPHAASALRITDCWPQPARAADGILHFSGESQRGTLLHGAMHDLLGRQVREWDTTVRPGASFMESIDIGGLAPGLYHIVLRSATATTKRQIVLQ